MKSPMQLRDELWVASEPWLADAKCVVNAQSPSFFFPGTEDVPKPRNWEAEAVAYCNGGPHETSEGWRFRDRCPYTGITGACVRFNLRTVSMSNDAGVWGGTTAAERKKLRKARRNAE